MRTQSPNQVFSPKHGGIDGEIKHLPINPFIHAAIVFIGPRD